MGLLSMIGSAQQQEVDRAKARYAELLAAEEDGNPKAAAELRSIMEMLDKSVEDARMDKRIIDQAKTNRQAILNGKGLEAAREKAANAWQAYHEETKRIVEQRRAEQVKLQNASNVLESRYGSGQRAFHELTNLKKQFPALLASIEMPDSFN